MSTTPSDARPSATRPSPPLTAQLVAASTPVILIDVLNTEPTTLRIDTSLENGAQVDLELVGATPGARAAQLQADLQAERDTSTFFKAVRSGTTVQLRPRVRHGSLRRISLQVVSGEGVSFTNLDGSPVGTTPVPVAPVSLGRTIRLAPGVYDLDGLPNERIVIDTPDFVIEGGPSVVIRASSQGVFQVEAEGFRCRSVQFVWEADGAAVNDQVMHLIAASDWQFEDCEFSVDGVVAGRTRAVVWCDQLTQLYPDHRSHAYRRMKLLDCSFYLGNNAIGLYVNSGFDIAVTGCLFTSLYGRTNAFGDGAKVLYDTPKHAIWIVNADYIKLHDNNVLNLGGHADGSLSDAAMLIERTGSGTTGANEGGHLRVSGGRIHGTVEHYAAQLVLRRLWFARVIGVELHRHLLGTPTPHAASECAGISIQDCVQVLVQGCEFFNFGTDGGDYARYPALGVLSLGDPVSEVMGDRSKILRVDGCTMDNKVAATAAGLENAHPFLQYFNTAHGHRYDLFDISGNTLISGGWAAARFSIVDNDALAAGEGFALVIPAHSFGPGAPAVSTTLQVTEGDFFDAAEPSGGAHETARRIAQGLNEHAEFQAYLRASVSEAAYQAAGAPGAGATVLIESLTHGAAAHAVTVEHLSSVPGTTALTVGRAGVTPVAEGATANLAGGYGDTSVTGQTCIVLEDPQLTPSPADLGAVAPKQVSATGNSFRGWYAAVSGASSVERLVIEANSVETTTGS